MQQMVAAFMVSLNRPENVENFQRRHAQQEAAYRCKVHEGKETLKKTSQVLRSHCQALAVGSPTICALVYLTVLLEVKGSRRQAGFGTDTVQGSPALTRSSSLLHGLAVRAEALTRSTPNTLP